jgi:hypothetical protein
MFSITRLIQHFTFMIAVAILCSFVRIYTYYYSFGINIVSFVEVSEILGNSVDIFILLMGCSTIFFLLFLFKNDFRILNIREKLVIPERNARTLKQTFLAFRGIIYRNVIIMMPFSIIYVFKTFEIIHIFIYIFISALAIWNIKVIFTLSDEDLKNADHLKVDLKSIIVVTIICISVTLFALFGKMESYGKKEMVNFCYNDQTINSSDSFYMIGKTNKYLFMYDEILRKTTVYLFDDLKYFSIDNRNRIKKRH